MDSELVTRDDLRMFGIQLINDIKQILDGDRQAAVKHEWLKSKQVREMLKVSPGTLQISG